MSSHEEIMTSAFMYSKQRTLHSFEHLSRLCLDDLIQRGVPLHEDVLIRLVCTTLPELDEISHTQQVILSPPATSIPFEKVRDDNYTGQAASTNDHISDYDDNVGRRSALDASHSPISNTAEPDRVPEPGRINSLPESEENQDIYTFPAADSHIWRGNSIPNNVNPSRDGFVPLKTLQAAINNQIVHDTHEHQDSHRETNPGRQSAEATTSTTHEGGHNPRSAHLSTTRPSLYGIPNDEITPVDSLSVAPTPGQKRRITDEDRDSSYSDGAPSDDEERIARPRKQRKMKAAQSTTQETRARVKVIKVAPTPLARLRARQRMERDIQVFGPQPVLPGVTLKQILDVTLPNLNNAVKKADVTDLCIRLFHTEKAFHIIYQGGQHKHQADDLRLSHEYRAILSSLVNDPSHLLKGKVDHDHQSILNRLKVHQICSENEDQSIQLDSTMRHFLERERQPSDGQESHLGSTCDVASLVIGVAYGGKLTGAARSEAEHRLRKRNEESEKLLLLMDHLGSGSLVMLSSTPWRAILHRIQYDHLETSLLAMTTKFPDLRTIFNKLDVTGLNPPNRPAINLKKMSDFAKFISGEHYGSLAAARRTAALKGKGIASRTNAASQMSRRPVQELEDVGITVQQHHRPNQAPVAAMASRSCQ